ncbi:hypothetical protein PG994_010724 [Apiospora phragmitis]|uniref:Uncharacterized protein n=1 Tax=Apiospora phragmitis TaxID=2905665 RepID=A0ABR1TTE0_9PEZI
MRLRATNKQKRFRTSDHIPSLGSSDDEADGVAKVADEDSNDAFINAPGAEDDGDNVVEPDPTSESDNPPSHDPGSVKIRSRRNVIKNKLREPETERPPGEVQPYPSDPASRWTRAYVGPVTRWSRFPELCQYWFDDRNEYQKVIDVYLSMWARHELLPPRLLSSEQLSTARNPWMPTSFPEDQENTFLQWYIRHLSSRAGGQKSTLMPDSTALRWYLPQTATALISLLGPFDALKEYKTHQGQSITLATNSLPVEDDSPDDGIEQGGFLLDVGGIVMTMGWAPLKRHGDQLLAMAIIPFADQAYYSTPEEAPEESTMKQGSIQIWQIQVEKTERGITRPSRAQPRLAAALCFDWGRVVCMQWCPVPLPVDDHISLLAALCSDGRLRVVEVRKPQLQGSNATYEEIQEPLAVMEIRNEQGVEVSCFTWINTNRIATGLTDGSVVVWSIFPCRILQRHPVHSSPVMDITSSYPSHPFVIVTLPVGGVATITDLSKPNGEMVYNPNLIIDFQPNLLAWCEHMRGFVGVWPSAFPASGCISFMSARVFPQARLVLSLDGQPTCLAVGSCHPYVLIGSSDGSLWIVNVFRKVTFYRKASHKLKLFQHEFQETPIASKANNGEDEQAAPRGVCRILQGFRPLRNGHPKASRGLKMRQTQIEQTKNRKKAKAASAKKKGRSKDKVPTQDNAAEEDEDASRVEDQADVSVPSGEIAVYAPLSRITSVCWNPNVDFSWWAAAAMGSGLVRIMDLGVDMRSDHRPPAGGDIEEDPGLDIGQDFQPDEDMEDAEDDFGEGEILGDEGADDPNIIGGGWTAVNNK